MPSFVNELLISKGIDARRISVVFDNAYMHSHAFSRPTMPRYKNKRRLVAVKENRWSPDAIHSKDCLRLPSRRRSVEVKCLLPFQALRAKGSSGSIDNPESSQTLPQIPRRRSSVEDFNSTCEASEVTALLLDKLSIFEEDDESSNSFRQLPTQRRSLAADAA
ncbi:hypothetical protein MPSEU_001041900 [Mayamaea pseudoterrestris]|nr:hypothetical protein MPSEU_001041900 [Mayamaea pseudoterrestris]